MAANIAVILLFLLHMFAPPPKQFGEPVHNPLTDPDGEFEPDDPLGYSTGTAYSFLPPISFNSAYVQNEAESAVNLLSTEERTNYEVDQIYIVGYKYLYNNAAHTNAGQRWKLVFSTIIVGQESSPPQLWLVIFDYLNANKEYTLMEHEELTPQELQQALMGRSEATAELPDQKDSAQSENVQHQ